MQNKYSNIIFYLFIIVIVSLCGLGTVKRYQADFYFNVARNCIPSYADKNEKLDIMQYAYWKAVEANPLEYEHYSKRLNSDYLKRISKRR